MATGKSFVIREIGGEDSKPFAVVRHGRAFQGKWEREVLWVQDWHETEDQARAYAHRDNHPDWACT